MVKSNLVGCLYMVDVWAVQIILSTEAIAKNFVEKVSSLENKAYKNLMVSN